MWGKRRKRCGLHEEELVDTEIKQHRLGTHVVWVLYRSGHKVLCDSELKALGQMAQWKSKEGKNVCTRSTHHEEVYVCTSKFPQLVCVSFCVRVCVLFFSVSHSCVCWLALCMLLAWFNFLRWTSLLLLSLPSTLSLLNKPRTWWHRAQQHRLQQRMHIKIHLYLDVYLPIANMLDWELHCWVGCTKTNIRASRQKHALQKLSSQKFSLHLPGCDDACKISAIVSKCYRCTPPPCTVWLFGDNYMLAEPVYCFWVT